MEHFGAGPAQAVANFYKNISIHWLER